MAASMVHGGPLVTPLAEPVPLRGAAAVDDATAADRLHPLYAAALRRFPRGPIVSRGLRFQPAGDGATRRWVLIDAPTRIHLDGASATWLVLLHFCDAWRDSHGRRPTGVPVG
ncbi:MAG TPA: hypothetical protein VJZ50_09690, partial [Candidatus Limnocylindrales bacterium]|nr:hypothetical protein [Candidatus Limnocylindrales bacterium]